jgi:hypothetical protein
MNIIALEEMKVKGKEGVRGEGEGEGSRFKVQGARFKGQGLRGEG